MLSPVQLVGTRSRLGYPTVELCAHDSWDEGGVTLNAWGDQQPVKCTVEGRGKLALKNLAPVTTETQQQRRTIKMGLRKCA